METLLKSINSVAGVSGSFVSLADGTVAAKVMPEYLEGTSVQLSARVVSQTFFAIEASGQHVSEVNLVFDHGRLILRNLHGGVLVILCTRNINVALLNLTVNGIVKKLTADLKQPKPVKAASPASISPSRTEPIMPPTPAAVTLPEPEDTLSREETLPLSDLGQVSPSPLFVELEQEVNRLRGLTQNGQIALYALEPVAFWDRCPKSRRLLAAPHKRYLSFLATQGVSIRSMFESAGYRPIERMNDPSLNRRLSFFDSTRDLIAEVYLDVFEMYQSIDLAELFDFDRLTLTEIFNEKTPPETYLALIRLQLVEMPEEALGDLAALFLDHKLSMGQEEGSINVLQIAGLCSVDWPWYKTVSMNLDRLVFFAQGQLSLQEQTLVIERTHILEKAIESNPKSLQWRARALRGESVKWYATPQVPTSP